MTKFIVAIALGVCLAAYSTPSSGQHFGEVYKNSDSKLSWWERVTNKYNWIRKQIGSHYKFENSIGVIIAIDDYSGDFEDLSSPVADSVRMRNFLLKDADFDEVIVLTNEHANRDNIREVMEEIIPRKVGPNDRLLVYWSGHGGSARDVNGRAYGFLGLQNASKDGRRDSIHMDEARSWLRRIVARQVLFIIDACYSGLSLQMASTPTDPTWEHIAGPGHHLLTSSSSNQVSYGYTDGSGGLFTTAFLEGARGKADYNKDGITTITEIAAHLETRLSAATGLGFEQTPQFGTLGRQEGRFFFLSGHHPNFVQKSEQITTAIEASGDSCNAPNSEYELFVRSSKACWEVEAFLENHATASSCTAVQAAIRRKDELCLNQTASGTKDPCEPIILPSGMECKVSADGRAAVVPVEKIELRQGAPDPIILRIQTHFSPETVSGKALARFASDVERKTTGQVTIETFYSSSVVSSLETFDAAAAGILDCDMTSGGYQTGKNRAFQFVGDIYGGYETSAQLLSWLDFENAEELVQGLYGEYGMHFVGFWITGPESLSTSFPLRGLTDVSKLKFRTPPGDIAQIWKELGAQPVLMSFTEIFTALEEGIINGADASNLANNTSLGLYDLVQHATYPGFHSMPADHLACNKEIWDSISAKNQKTIVQALKKMAEELAAEFDRMNKAAAQKLTANGIKLHNWSKQDRQHFRMTSLSIMERNSRDNNHAMKLLSSHRRYMKAIALLN